MEEITEIWLCKCEKEVAATNEGKVETQITGHLDK